jgi:cell fate regulator YaaT (PSP1 superfamily)
MMMAVSFERYGRLYYLDPGPYSPSIGDKVLVPTDSGPEVAECIWAPQWVTEDIAGLPVCAGMASEADLARDEGNRRKRAEARLTAKRLVREHALPMKITAVDYLDPRSGSAGSTVVIIYFSAPHRVDFRALVRDLASRLRARVELRQIGPRDEARLQGGIGPCGRDLCCATFLKDFEPVSVRMAKDQDLPVNPLRIAGACGRLMCCLKYEHPLYQDFHANAPKVGEQVDSPEGPGTVIGHNVPSDTVVMKLAADGRRCACPRASVCGSRQAYEARYSSPGAGTGPSGTGGSWPRSVEAGGIGPASSSSRTERGGSTG